VDKIKFCVKIGKCASEMLALLMLAYGEYAMKKFSVFEWQRWFKKGQADMQDDPRSGQPKSQRTGANVNTIQTLVRLVAEELNMGICLEEKIQTLA
jgi:hypothetical protein